MRIEGVSYELVRGSDIVRDGFFLQCERLEANGDRTLVLEAFWHDQTGRFAISFHEPELPFELVRAFVTAAAQACPPTSSTEVGTVLLIYVKLVDENVDAWRPTLAELVGDGAYRITGERPDDENWEFDRGTLVRGQIHRFSDGSQGLVATRYAG